MPRPPVGLPRAGGLLRSRPRQVPLPRGAEAEEAVALVQLGPGLDAPAGGLGRGAGEKANFD